jgi:hypothetical protein
MQIIYKILPLLQEELQRKTFCQEIKLIWCGGYIGIPIGIARSSEAFQNVRCIKCEHCSLNLLQQLNNILPPANARLLFRV